jgi:hypothetical protein
MISEHNRIDASAFAQYLLQALRRCKPSETEITPWWAQG